MLANAIAIYLGDGKKKNLLEWWTGEQKTWNEKYKFSKSNWIWCKNHKTQQVIY